jgi:hypothetical protein
LIELSQYAYGSGHIETAHKTSLGGVSDSANRSRVCRAYSRVIDGFVPDRQHSVKGVSRMFISAL